MNVERARVAPTASTSRRRSSTTDAVPAARDRIQASTDGRSGTGGPASAGVHLARRAYVTKKA